MWYTSIENVEDFVVCSLLVKLMDDTARNINDLNDGHVLQSTWSNLEVLFLNLGGIMRLDQFEYEVIIINLHDFAESETILDKSTLQTFFIIWFVKNYLLK